MRSCGCAIVSEQLTKRYGATKALDSFDLAVAEGTVCGLLGPNGAGKTTLVRMINRLVEPSSGRVRIDGEDTRAVPAHVLRRRIGYVIQSHGLLPHRTVAQNIATVPKLLGWDRARRRARAFPAVGHRPDRIALDRGHAQDRDLRQSAMP